MTCGKCGKPTPWRHSGETAWLMRCDGCGGNVLSARDDAPTNQPLVVMLRGWGRHDVRAHFDGRRWHPNEWGSRLWWPVMAWRRPPLPAAEKIPPLARVGEEGWLCSVW